MRNTRNTGTMMKMKIQENKQIEVSRFSGLSGYRDISHFTTTRHGGVSTGTYASMNPGVYTRMIRASSGRTWNFFRMRSGFP